MKKQFNVPVTLTFISVSTNRMFCDYLQHTMHTLLN